MQHLSIILALVLLYPYNLFPQKILKRTRHYVVININESSGFKKGDRISIFRQFKDTHKEIGRAEFTQYKKKKGVAKIIAEYSPYTIAVGDVISAPEKQAYADSRDMPSQTSAPFQPVSDISVRNNSINYFPYISIGVGIGAAGFSYYFLNQANKTYQDYEAATTADDAVRLFDETMSLDKKAQISLSIGGGMIALGIVQAFIHGKRKSNLESKSFSISPVQRNQYAGVSIRYHF